MRGLTNLKRAVLLSKFVTLFSYIKVNVLSHLCTPQFALRRQYFLHHALAPWKPDGTLLFTILSLAQVSVCAFFISKSEMIHISSHGPRVISSSYLRGFQIPKLRICLHNEQALTTSALRPGLRSVIEWKLCISILQVSYYLLPQRSTPWYLKSILSGIRQANIIWSKALPFNYRYMYWGYSYHETLKLNWNMF